MIDDIRGVSTGKARDALEQLKEKLRQLNE
jgi:hypothetical protein